MVIVWFVILLIMLFIEIITINLVSIWFAVGAFASCIVAYFTDNVVIQIIVFMIVSVLMLLLMKPIVKKIKKRNHIATNVDRVIGMEGIVTQPINKNEVGEVKVDGKRWSAISKEQIDKGSIVKIQEIDGVKLIVKKED